MSAACPLTDEVEQKQRVHGEQPPCARELDARHEIDARPDGPGDGCERDGDADEEGVEKERNDGGEEEWGDAVTESAEGLEKGAA